MRIAMVGSTDALLSARASWQAQALKSRGDEVVVVDNKRAWAEAARVFLRARRSFDVVIACDADAIGFSRVLAGLRGRVAVDIEGAELGRLATMVALGEWCVSAVVARTQAQYGLLLNGGATADRLFLVREARDLSGFSPRESQPQKGKRRSLQFVVHGSLTADDARVLVDAMSQDRISTARFRVVSIATGDGAFVLEKACREDKRIGDRCLVHLDPSHDQVVAVLRESDIAVVLSHQAAVPCEEAWTVGLGTIVSTKAPMGATDEERTTPSDAIVAVAHGDSEGLANALVTLATDGARCKKTCDAAVAWREEFGFEKQRQLFLRLVDYLGGEKIRSEKRDRQAAIEGKTGETRKDDARHSANA